MDHGHSTRDGPNDASGFVCPRCGGALWERRNGAPSAYECRVGDRFSEAELWIEHSVARNRTLLVAARSLAENAALALRLAASARRRGDAAVAERLEEEARDEERLCEQVRAMLEGRSEPDLDVAR